MLFDLQGKRRRVVQATYLGLAVLMGGGLVLFGIGGDVSGGLFDAFSDRSGSSGNDIVEERVQRNEERVQTNPNAIAARKELVRDYYQLAVSQADDRGVYPADAQDELRKAARNWSAYIEAEDGDPDASLARVALRVYDVTALNQPEEAMRAARIIAQDTNDPSGYVQLAQYAVLAGDKRTENLATDKAIELSPERDRQRVRRELRQLKAALIASQLQQEGGPDIELEGQGGGAGGGGQGGGQQGGGQ